MNARISLGVNQSGFRLRRTPLKLAGFLWQSTTMEEALAGY